MIYVILKGTGYGDAEIFEFATETGATHFLGGKPVSRVLGVFSGKRLDIEVGTKRVTKKGVVGFKKYEEEE